MRLPEPLMRLPLSFDVAALAAEVDRLPASAWTPHPDNIPGNAAVRLITPGGGATEGTHGCMAATEHLKACPYIASVLAAIGAIWGRTRLMRLAPGALVPPHIDTNFYWRKHVRIHVPVVTNPQVSFTCDGRTVHMAAGECWVFDTFARHRVANAGSTARVHLVADTVGDERLWDLINAAPSKSFAPGKGISAAELQFERGEPAEIMTPWELKYHVAFITERARPAPALAAITALLERFSAAWTGSWARSGAASDRVAAFQRHVVALQEDLLRIDGGDTVALDNGLPLYRQIAELLFNVEASLASASGRAAGPACQEGSA